LHRLHGGDDLAELADHRVELGVGEVDAGQRRQVGHVVTGEVCHAGQAMSWRATRPPPVVPGQGDRSPVPSCRPPWLLAGTTGTSPTLVSTCARTRGCWAPRDCECTSYPRVGSVDNHRHAGRRTTRMLDVPVQ